jgi:hypothetical protein
MSIVPRAKKVIANFSPNSIGGCQLWLDAADSSTITGSSPVTAWRDKSVNGDTLIATGSPTITTVNGLNSLSFNGTSYFSLNPYTKLFGTSYVAWFAVANVTNAASAVYGSIIGTSYTANYYSQNLMYINSGSLMVYYRVRFGDGAVNTTVALNAGNVLLGTATDFTAGTYQVFQNGTPGTLQTNGLTGTVDTSAVSLQVAYDGYPGESYVEGTISEILLFTTALTTPQRQQIEGYLAQKWGLTASLPAGHPGLTQTFYGTGQSTVFTPIVLIPYNLYTNYNPLTATGSTCILWLDASDPTTLFSDPAGTTLATVNGTVGYWRDKSSSGFNCTQTTLAYRPTYVAAAKNGRSILSFNGLTNFLNMPQFTAVPLTIFFVAQGTVFLTNTFFLSLGNAGSTIMMRMLHIPEYYGVDGPGMLISTTNADTNWHLWSLTISSTTVTFYFDGVLIGNSVMNLGSAYTFATNTIGAWNQQVGSKATTLRIPEILFYSAVLGTSQQKQVESYLTEKWALVSQPTRSFASIVSVPKIGFASSGLVITHQDGRSWKLSGSSIGLNTGTEMSLTIYAGSDVFNSANGRVGLFNNGSSSAAVRHASYVMWANQFGANNYDWGWYFVSSGLKYLIYNDFPSIGSAWQVSYDPAQDRVLIVPPGDAKYGMLWTITPRVTLSYVYTSYPT